MAQRFSNAETAAAAAQQGVDLPSVLRLVRTDPDFRRELKDVISEMIKEDLDRLREEMSNGGVEKPKLDAAAIVAREFPGAQLTTWSHQDAQGQVYGFPETIEVELIRHNSMAYLCSIRESVDIADVVFLIRIGRLYKSINPQSALACIIIARTITDRAKGIADRCKMKTILQAWNMA